ncbi:MAG: DNA-processing protein DprA [Candidatus Wolfebacteria bacterium]|nr:DNA-processing protein DprA [Candidatus Wolfebacteria bacterium]
MGQEKSKKEIKSAEAESGVFPPLLREIPGVPPRIYFLGNLPDENIFCVAIVGTRKATQAGKILAKKMAAELAKRGILIVSGLAMGIDSAAHEGALSVNGKTIAVLACGLDIIYPAQNEYLARKILDQGGGIISEYPQGTPPYPNQFLARNRIISGLCRATIVIEAPIESGSLVTARMAADQGRDVFVFPGPIDHPNYRGSHKLIRDGAVLVASIEDIIESLEIENEEQGLKWNLSSGKLPFGSFGTKEEELIFNAIKNTGSALSVDKIIEITRLEPQVVNRSLAYLAINNIIKETERGYAV